MCADTPSYIQENISLVPFNTVKTGGTASYYALAKSYEELHEVIAFANQQTVPLYVLGAGSNVLISEGHLKGIVLQLSGCFAEISCDNTFNFITAGAGTSLISLGKLLARKGYDGFAYMGVIPGTIGGAVRMNAGINEYDCISKDFLSARIYCRGTESIIDYSLEEMQFGYRRSSVQNSDMIILQSSFRLPVPGPSAIAERRLKELRSQRRMSHPPYPKTFGSVFKNPENHEHSAGWYIEQCGMKGLRIGGASIAREHANWIVNTRSARSSDIKTLIDMMQRKVFEKFGVALEREVIYLPEDVQK